MISARLALFALVATGCGRFGFDGHGHEDGAAPPGEAAPTHDDAHVYHLDAGDCPPGYTAIGLDAGTGAKSCYRYDEAAALSWIDAEHLCEADAAGAHLVVIDDDSEAAVVDTLQTVLSAWVGISDRVTAGKYLTVTGGAPAVLNWDVGEPTDDATSHCVEYTDARVFDDLPCEPNLNEYICEYDGIPAQPSAY